MTDTKFKAPNARRKPTNNGRKRLVENGTPKFLKPATILKQQLAFDIFSNDFYTNKDMVIYEKTNVGRTLRSKSKTIVIQKH